MSVKTTLKKLLKSVDEALLKEIKTSRASQAHAPSLQVENLACQPGPLLTLSPLSTLVSPGNTKTAPTDLSSNIDTLVAPKHVQINSPHRIEPELLKPFQNGLKDITLIFVRNHHVIQARLESIHDTYLVVRTQHSTYFRKRGEIVLILIPALSQKRYVLQATIEDIYAHRLVLHYQDPRYDVRHQIRMTTPVLLRPLPEPLVTAIHQRRTRIIRQMTLPPKQSLGTIPGRLEDRLCEFDAMTPSPFMHLIDQNSPLTGHLRDVSLGGLCLDLPNGPSTDPLLHRIILLHLAFPLVRIHAVNRQYLPVELNVIGTVRSIGTPVQPSTLHVRLLLRLPEDLEPYLSALEHCAVQVQHPPQ